MNNLKYFQLRRSVGYLIRIDDIAPNMNWPAYFRVKSLFAKYNIRPVIGVIPNNQDPVLKKFPICPIHFWNEIRSAQQDGWTIAMHGYQHTYTIPDGDDYFGNKGPSEFVSYSYEDQLDKLANGLKIFTREGISTDVFFAPSHTFDFNTVKALKTLGFNSILDGYGLFPYFKDDLIFIPQLIGRPIAFPFGLHTSVHHLNNYQEQDFSQLEIFVKRHHAKIINYETAIKMTSQHFLNDFSGHLIKVALQAKRSFTLLRCKSTSTG